MMVNIRKHKLAAVVVLLVLAFIVAFAVSQVFFLRNAHSTFENYYAFRGCVQLLDKTDTYGTCRTDSGQVIKIVEFNGKWYLDGDLPWGCVGGICFGW